MSDKSKKEKEASVSFELQNVELHSLNAKRIESSEQKGAKPDRTNNIKLVSYENGQLIIESHEKITFGALCYIELKLQGVYKVSSSEAEEIPKEFINEVINDISSPLLSSFSYIVSFITQQMLGHPIIVPPKIKKK